MTSALGALLFVLFAPPQDLAEPLPPLWSLNIERIVGIVRYYAYAIQDKSKPVEWLSETAYTETEIVSSLDSKGNPKGSEKNVYQVTVGVEPWQFYRKLISKNGVPLTPSQLAKQDREQKKREEEQEEKAAKEAEKDQREAEKYERAAREAEKKWSTPASQPSPRAAPSPEQQEKQREMIETGFVRAYSRIFDMQVVRREIIDGQNAVLVTFRPKPHDKKIDDTLSDTLKAIQHVAIDAWVVETTRPFRLVKLDVHVVDTISFGLGLIARFNKGSSLLIERRMVKPNIWAPVKIDGVVNTRVLLVKGTNSRAVSTYSDFKKFAVETVVRTVPPADAK